MSAPVTVIFVCSKCCAGYQAAQERRQTEKASDSFKCEICDTQVYAWSGSYAYVDWEAVETIPKPRRVARPNGKFR